MTAVEQYCAHMSHAWHIIASEYAPSEHRGVPWAELQTDVQWGHWTTHGTGNYYVTTT